MAQLAEEFVRRIPVAVDNTGGAVVNKDVTIALGPTAVAFWDAVDSNGYQIRITAADGVTELRWGRASFDYPNRECTLKVLGDSGSGAKWTPPATGMCLLHLYVGNASITTDAADGRAEDDIEARS